MAEFTPIETQEAFDAAIKERIDRAKSSVRDEYKEAEEWKKKAEEYDSKVKEYDDQLAALHQQIAEKDSSIDELNGKIKTRETAAAKSRIAREHGIPEDLADRLTGESEDDWKKDAEKLAKLFQKKPAYPTKNTTEPVEDKKTQNMKSLLKNLRGE